MYICHMKVILDIDTKYLDQFQAMADQDRRSRKNFMESILINFITGNPPTLERQSKGTDTAPDLHISSTIEKYEAELATLQKGMWADTRRNFLNREIAKLKKISNG
jgi:hypothetical protein